MNKMNRLEIDSYETYLRDIGTMQAMIIGLGAIMVGQRLAGPLGAFILVPLVYCSVVIGSQLLTNWYIDVYNHAKDEFNNDDDVDTWIFVASMSVMAVFTILLVAAVLCARRIHRNIVELFGL